MIRRALALGALILAVAAPRPSRAYVRGTTPQSQLPTFWGSSCELITTYLNGFTQMTPDAVAKSVAAAAHAWSPDAVACPTAGADAGSGPPSFEIITQMASGGPVPAVAADGKNVLVFETQGWEHGDAIAVTSRNADPSGRIFDADIEVNATGVVTWGNLDPGVPAHGEEIDLQTALTHEFGHFLGLAHTCYNDGFDPPPRPVDDQGRPSPDCTEGSGIPEAGAVMWFKVDPGATAKRVITADDARGVCAIYPPNALAATCAENLPEDGCGCRTARSTPGWPTAAIAVAALLMARRRRRARR